MKILFIENRYKTALWEIIAKMYQEMGHEIFWIVQNPLFKPLIGNINILPFPCKLGFEKSYSDSIKKIIAADRGLNYFGVQSDDFIFWYEDHIEKLIELVRPDVVFGESTLFHELLVIESCRKRNIKYLHPSTCRYPTGRFSFYLYDTLTPFGESGDQFSHEDALPIVNAIAKRKKLPDYMQILKPKISLKERIKDSIKLSLGYMIGERFNTPSPIRKLFINRHFKQNIKIWEQLALGVDQLHNSFNILYPLQMQPEANIDVWGYPYNDQSKVIEWIVENLKDGEKLVIKPNPKSKYEISDKLLAIIKKEKNKIIPLLHSTKMNDIWPYASLVVTVTGTISIECIFDNKPVVMLGQGLQSEQKNCMRMKNGDSLRDVIKAVKENTYPTLAEKEKIDFLQTLMKSSFPGINGDGLHNSHYLKGDNLKKLSDAYKFIIDAI